MLSAAARAGQTSVVQLILRSCEIHEAGVFHALREGVDNSSYGAVELLLDQCRTEYEGCSNISVLIRSAVGRGDVKIVGILAKRCRSDAMESALENAAKRGNRDMVKLLLDTCATRNLNDSTLRCTVAEAAKNAISCGDVEVAKLLLGEYDGSGAGQVKSARKGKLGVLSTLLELSDHETVLDALFKIASPENVEMSKLMLEKCDDSVFAQIFGHAAEHGFVALVQRLLDRVDPCTVNRALVRAAVRGHAEVVQALLGRCDETNIDFALEVAAWVGHADVVVMLRDRCDPGSVKNALANATAMEVVHLLSNKKARTA